MAETIDTASASSVAASKGSYVEWSAVLAGGVLAAATSFVLLAFGAAIGLSATSPWQTSRLSPVTIATLAIAWAMIQQIGAVMAGGYIAGRMRARWAETDEDEVDFRDGLHGGLVWAVGVLLSAFLAISAVGSAARTAADVAGRAASNPATTDFAARQVDILLRPAPGRPAGQGNTAEMRNELVGTFTRSIASGSLSDEDRTYITGLVAERGGVPRDEADKRVRAAFAEASRTTKEAADKARRGGVLMGLVTAVALLASLAAGWWAAIKGGNHRDNRIPARFVPRRMS